MYTATSYTNVQQIEETTFFVQLLGLFMLLQISYFYKEDLLTYKDLQTYATKCIHIYNTKYNKIK